VPRAGLEPARLAAGDFESPASTCFTTWAGLAARATARAGRGEDADYGGKRDAGQANASGSLRIQPVNRCAACWSRFLSRSGKAQARPHECAHRAMAQCGVGRTASRNAPSARYQEAAFQEECSGDNLCFVSGRGSCVPPRLRCMLHRAVDFEPDSGYAAWQACGRALCAAWRRLALRNLWPARTAGLLFRPAAAARHVRRIARRCAGVARAPRSADATLSNSVTATRTIRACAVPPTAAIKGEPA
jgi:hypothetical protein